MPLELGVFIPVGNNGWIISKTSPQYLPTYELNRQISVLAEQVGFDYVFSMAKWRGFGGETRFWDYSLESTMLMASGARCSSVRFSTAPKAAAPSDWPTNRRNMQDEVAAPR